MSLSSYHASLHETVTVKRGDYLTGRFALWSAYAFAAVQIVRWLAH